MSRDKDYMLQAFPSTYNNDIEYIFSSINFEFHRVHENTIEININGETVKLPSRIYYHEPSLDELSCLDDFQQRLLHCYFTRHCDGYIRQRSLNQILRTGRIEYWELPYIISLSGEYVVEIIEDIYKAIDLIKAEDLRRFIHDNLKLMTTIEGRIASYWGEYYRLDVDKRHYNGFKISKYYKHMRKLL